MICKYGKRRIRVENKERKHGERILTKDWRPWLRILESDWREETWSKNDVVKKTWLGESSMGRHDGENARMRVIFVHWRWCLARWRNSKQT